MVVAFVAALCLLAASCSSDSDVERVEAVASPASTASPEATATAMPWPTAAVFECPVTLPNGVGPPNEPPANLLGNAFIATGLWRDGKVIFRPGGPGLVGQAGFSMKWFWWRLAEGQLRIEGRRLNGAPGDQFHADIPAGYGNFGFQASSLTFSSQGCWEVTGHLGSESLTFVVSVVASP